MAEFIQIEGWEELQHYKDRNPPWIKLPNHILDSFEFSCLHSASKWASIGLMLLASRHDNLIPNEPRWIQHMLHLENPPDIDALVSAGLIRVYDDGKDVLAECVQDASAVLAQRRGEERRVEESKHTCDQEPDPQPPAKKKPAKPKKPKAPSIHELSFKAFWAAWPEARRQERKAALAQWVKLAPDAKLAGQIIGKVEALKKTDAWADPRYIKHAHRWLKGECWTDPVMTEQGGNGAVRDTLESFLAKGWTEEQYKAYLEEKAQVDAMSEELRKKHEREADA